MTGELLLRIALSSALATLAAAAAERGLREAGRPGRWPWAGALAGTAFATVLLLVGGSLPLRAPAGIGLVTAELASGLRAPAPLPGGEGGVHLTRALLVGWTLATGLLLACLALAAVRQWRRISRGRPARIAGQQVVVTDALGPAVAGLLRTVIVVPRWVLDLPGGEQRLIVRHEAEHRAARDRGLAGVALLLACLLPWNAALWYQLRRLRFAIEADCDARVLRAERTSRRGYSMLLIDVAGRARGGALATSLLHPRTTLERRIRMITHQQRRPGRSALWAFATVMLVAGACAEAADPVDAVLPAVEAENAALAQLDGPAGTLEGGESRRKVEAALAADPRSPAGLLVERTVAGQPAFAVSDAPPSNADARSRVIRFEAQIGPDGRAIALRFPEGTTQEYQRSAREALAQTRFRREADAPADAWISGFITLR